MQELTYTITEDDHYYFFDYTPFTCPDDELIGTMYLQIEYSVSAVETDGVCNTHDSPSCTLSVPLGAEYEKVLITVGGDVNDLRAKHDISFSSSNRKWAYFVVVAAAFLPLLSVLSTIVMNCLCYIRLHKDMD